MKILIFLFSLSFISLSYSQTQTTAIDVTGSFDCPAYKNADNHWNAYKLSVEQKTLDGLPIIVEEMQGDVSDKTGPYNKDVSVLDGLWRYSPFFRKGKLYAVKTKSWIQDGKVFWTAEYPAYVDNDGKKQKASSGHGAYWLNGDGDLVSEASHYSGTYTCKKIAKK